MKASEVHKMSNEELEAEEKRQRRRLFDLRAQAVTDKLENPRLFAAHKKDIARILTEKKLRQSNSSKGKA